MIAARVLADSLAPCGKRLTTFELTYPRFIHSELLTHKLLSRNSASSRAIPAAKLISRVQEDPVVPLYIGANQKGMQAGQELNEDQKAQARYIWLAARDEAVERASQLNGMGVHKSLVNRVVEPWMWITVIVSATEWDNFFGLRDHEAAEPHFQDLARKMRVAREATSPRVLAAGEWHLPLVDWNDEVDQMLSLEDLIKVSVGRCARVSYLTHDGRRAPEEDIALHDRMMAQRPLHASPAEHAAQALDWPDWLKRDWPALVRRGVDGLQNYVLQFRSVDEHRAPPQPIMSAETALAWIRSGNFLGFKQYRKTFVDEHIGGLKP